MHKHQKALLDLIKNKQIKKFSYRAIGEQIGVNDAPEIIKYHLAELNRNNLIEMNMRENVLRANKRGYQTSNSKIYYVPIVGKANLNY